MQGDVIYKDMYNKGDIKRDIRRLLNNYNSKTIPLSFFSKSIKIFLYILALRIKRKLMVIKSVKLPFFEPKE